MKRLFALFANRGGTAAAELALVMPMMLIIMFGSAEVGNYFLNEHALVKAVRDGARFAARQSFTNYTSCSGAPGGTVEADTKNVVMNGYLTGGALLVPNMTLASVTVSTSCSAMAGGETMEGIYRDRIGGSGAQIVTVSARVNYRSLIGAFGFTGTGMTLNAKSQAAVAGI